MNARQLGIDAATNALLDDLKAKAKPISSPEEIRQARGDSLVRYVQLLWLLRLQMNLESGISLSI